jgi:uncharacterized lipoprotein YmbA
MRVRLLAGLAVLALAASACALPKHTREARFFALRAVGEPTPVRAAADGGGIVGVLPVSLPSHLVRPQFVAWSGPGEVKINEFLRWAEPLGSGAQRVLTEDLEARLPGYRVVKAPWPSATPLRCRVRAELVRFGAQPGGEVSLSGRFVLLPARSEHALVTRGVDLRRDPTSGPDDAARAVEAMSALLGDLAGQIAEAVAAVPPDPSETVVSAQAGKSE